MADVLEPASVADLILVEISGEKLNSLVVPRTRLEISLSMAPVGDDVHRSRVGASVRAFALVDGAPEDDDSTPLYEGSVAYIVRLVDEGPDDVWLDGSTVVNFVWPYLRAGLLEQASRLGTSQLSLPIAINATALQGADAAADVPDAAADADV